MRKRNKTMAQNAGVYGLILLVVGMNAYFWGTYVSRRRSEVDDLKKQIGSLEEDRKRREKELAAALKKKSLDAVHLLRDWELAYRKECFYHGIRVLMELERAGQSKL